MSPIDWTLSPIFTSRRFPQSAKQDGAIDVTSWPKSTAYMSAEVLPSAWMIASKSARVASPLIMSNDEPPSEYIVWVGLTTVQFVGQ